MAGEKKKREKPFSMRITNEDRELLTKLTAAMDEPSDTQTIVKLIRKEARERGLLD